MALYSLIEQKKKQQKQYSWPPNKNSCYTLMTITITSLQEWPHLQVLSLILRSREKRDPGNKVVGCILMSWLFVMSIVLY